MPERPQFPIRIELSDPVEFGSDMIDTLEIKRKPKTGDLQGLPKDMSEYDKSLRLIGRITGYPPKVINELSLDDYQQITEKLAPFLPKQSD